MIYTITFNPALDHHVTVEDYRTGEVNRTSYERLIAGGKGINVSTVLHNLGHDTRALGFLAGETGEMIASMLRAEGLPAQFITLPEGSSRINIKIHARQETEINGTGPIIPREAMEVLYTQLERLKPGDWLVLAGSAGAGMPDTIYHDIMERLRSKDVRFAVDATGGLLRHALKSSPFLIKPNHHELGELFGVRLTSPSEIERYAKRLQEMGARNVLVSMADKGAVLVCEDGACHYRRALQGKAVNSTGAGDSMLAGFIAGMERYHDPERALHMGIAAASVSVFSGELAGKEKTEELFGVIEKAVHRQHAREEVQDA